MIASWTFSGLCLLLCLFQLALIAGAPWGDLTQGGRQEGVLSPGARLLSAVSIPILVFMALGILSAAGSWPHWPRFAGWLALGVTGLTTVANWASPSKRERLIWGPVSLAMLACALLALFNSQP
ncbi:hypothetical protein [Brevundimonas sp.]|uniref:hypothetical protein n=1 Tax=Brevundimonas sp. TaxID=1871086 RepID=UPI00286A708B|nr:hypothetical protein [Brevundimonas sp.]